MAASTCAKPGWLIFRNGAPLSSKACRPVKDIGNRIIKNCHGRQIGLKPLTAAPEFYAAMVILRECLHHLRFSEVVVQA